VKTYFFKLLPPRSTFPADMTPAEAKLMDEHADYWRRQLAAGRALVLGPVMDPAGAYGIGVICAANDADAQALAAADPALQAGIGFRFEVHPMASALVPP
jgi:uncharacterized protein YciI